jgi:hypothetical protein
MARVAPAIQAIQDLRDTCDPQATHSVNRTESNLVSDTMGMDREGIAI